jgi:hypothetical protein
MCGTQIDCVSGEVMNIFTKLLENLTYTENDALTYVSSGSAIVDFFFHGPALRKDMDGGLACLLFERAYAQDKHIALKTLFYIRDVRGGQGERQTFRHILKYLAGIDADWHKRKNSAGKENLALIPEYGRWDDLWILLSTELKDSVVDLVRRQLDADKKSTEEQNYHNISLLAKWLPSENASSASTKELSKVIIKALGITPKQYRKTLAFLRGAIDIVEKKLSVGEYSEIDYEKLPSLAVLKYRKAFARKDGERYKTYISQLAKGEKKINTAALYPYDLLRAYMPHGYLEDGIETDETVEQAWKNLPDYVPDISGLVVADTSGSMQGLPIIISISLAIYIAERNKNETWKDYFISFSKRPKFHKIEGDTLIRKADSVGLGNAENTDLQAVFNLVLDRAVKNNVPKEEMPNILLIISDMQFDQCVDNAANFEKIKERYKKNNLPMPKLVFWNVDSRQMQIPVTLHESGVLLLSGSNPICLKLAFQASGEGIEGTIIKIVDSKRYEAIEYL